MNYDITNAPRRRCQACGVTIAWVKSAKTLRLVPVNVETGRSHFEDCTDPNRFHRRAERVEQPGEPVRQARFL